MHQEYPKALYKRGEYMAVANFDEEESARADGWDDWAADHARLNAPADEVEGEPKRRGRPPKAKE